MMKKICFVAMVLLLIPAMARAELSSFNITTLDPATFHKFVTVFSEMRGPLRVEILKDSKSDFKNADPLKYVSKVQNEKDVKEILTKENLNWDQFTELMGNVLLAYFSTQPDKTKTALIKQLAEYDLTIAGADIPPEYQQMVKDTVKTDEGAKMAGMALDFLVQIPAENTDLAKKNKRTLDQLFYTKFWKDKI